MQYQPSPTEILQAVRNSTVKKISPIDPHVEIMLRDKALVGRSGNPMLVHGGIYARLSEKLSNGTN